MKILIVMVGVGSLGLLAWGIARWLNYQRWDELSHQAQIDRWYGEMPIGSEPPMGALHLPSLRPLKAQRAE